MMLTYSMYNVLLKSKMTTTTTHTILPYNSIFSTVFSKDRSEWVDVDVQYAVLSAQDSTAINQNSSSHTNQLTKLSKIRVTALSD